MVLGQQRLGVNVLSLIARLREEGRLPIRSVQWYLDTVHQLRLSVGAIVSASPAVHADETGWRQSGANGYVWTCSTPTERYFLRRGRGKTVVDQARRGPGAERCFFRSIGQRLLRCLPSL